MVKHGAKVLEQCRKMDPALLSVVPFTDFTSPNVQEIIARGGLEKWVKKEIEASA